MERAAVSLANRVSEFKAGIIGFTGGTYVYRCDFIVGGLHSMNVRFRFLRWRTGWFFGTRPEFHFVKLPIGWATVGTWLFLPPLAVTCWLITALAMLAFCHRISQGDLPW